MSNPMLSGVADLTVIDGTKVELVKGLGLLPSHIIVDQHFLKRSRFNRLAGVVLNQSNTVGLGIDEDTALMIADGVATVHGPTQVLIFRKLESKILRGEFSIALVFLQGFAGAKKKYLTFT